MRRIRARGNGKSAPADLDVQCKTKKKESQFFRCDALVTVFRFSFRHDARRQRRVGRETGLLIKSPTDPPFRYSNQHPRLAIPAAGVRWPDSVASGCWEKGVYPRSADARKIHYTYIYRIWASGEFRGPLISIKDYRSERARTGPQSSCDQDPTNFDLTLLIHSLILRNGWVCCAGRCNDNIYI